jgi:hypothetical protein
MLPSTGLGTRELLAILRYEIDQQSKQQAQKGIADIKKGLEDTARTADKTAKSTKDLMARFNEMRESAEKLQGISVRVGAAGAAVLAPLIGMSQKYLEFAGQSESISSRWINASKSLEQSGVRVGRVVTTELLPVLERAADIAERAAAFAETPAGQQAIRAALSIGGTLAAVSAVGMAAAQIKSAVGTAGWLLAKTGALNSRSGSALDPLISARIASFGSGGGGIAAATTTTLSVGSLIPYAVAITAGVIATSEAVSWVNDLLDRTGTNKQIDDARAKARSEGRKIYTGPNGPIRDPRERELQIKLNEAIDAGDAKKIKELTDEINSLGRSAEKAKNGLGQAGVKAFIAYLDQEQKTEKRYQEQRSKAVEDFERQRAEEEKDYQRERTQAESDFQRNRQKQLSDFAQNEHQETVGYYKRRLQATLDYNKEIQRREQDHQRDMQRQQEDHQERLQDFISSGDAAGFIKAQRQFERDRQRAEEDYSIRAGRESEDFASKISEMEADFSESRAVRRADFEQRLQDEAEEYQQRRQQEEADRTERLRRQTEEHTNQLSELDQQFENERRERKSAFTEQLADLDIFLDGEKDKRAKHYQKMSEALDEWLKKESDRMKGNSGISAKAGGVPGRASGGYVSRGLYMMHDNEFVLNAKSVSAAERLAQGRLTQDGIMSMLAGGRGSGGATAARAPINATFYFSGEYTPVMRNAVRGDFMDWMGEVLS